MADTHLNLKDQPKCQDLGSLTVVQLLDRFIKESVNHNKKWDLMIETNVGDIETLPLFWTQ